MVLGACCSGCDGGGGSLDGCCCCWGVFEVLDCCCAAGSINISMLCRKFARIESDWFIMFSNRSENVFSKLVGSDVRFTSGRLVRASRKLVSKSDRMCEYMLSILPV